MPRIAVLLILGCFLLVFAPVTQGKIHRAMAHTQRAATKTQRNFANGSMDNSTLYSFLSSFVVNQEAWVYSIPATLLVGCCGIFPLLVIPVEAGHMLKEGVSADRLKLLLSFAVGGLLGDVFLHLMPEAWAHINHANPRSDVMGIGMWTIAGIICFLFLEKMFADEEELKHMPEEVEEEDEDYKPQINGHAHTDPKEKPITNGVKSLNGVLNHNDADMQIRKRLIEENQDNNDNDQTEDSSESKEKDGHSSEHKEDHIKVMGYLNLFANCIDNFTHGLAVAGSFVVSRKVGMCTTLAILLHEIPHEIGDFAILLKSGFRRWDAAIGQVITASGGLLGCIVGLVAESAGDTTAMVLPFTSGGFIYIALVTVVPELIQEKRRWESFKQVLFLSAGVVCMGLVTLVHSS